MKVLKLIGIFLCMLLIFPTSASENSDTLNITQTKLYDSLSCEKVGKTASICLISSQFHSNPKAYVFKFLASGDFDKNKVEEITVMYATLMSTYLNPITASFYDAKPALIDMVDQSQLKAENIIVEIELNNNDLYYSSYLYPMSVNGKVSLVHNFFVGKVDAYEHLKSVCHDMKEFSESKIYLQRCTFYKE
ncbi:MULTISPECIES: hypothetical protein [Vibrio]|uniref:hypothetical protein n=1 Tax=Vibrio TaxID=662 RepID=UPI000619BC50|nr:MULTISPECIES: hypothetical protein [Vibrio]MBU2932913.1 hypothetical protein [Vibrio cyclitrophicus]NOH45490.1 hypothetical protein [Vibrio cyclitrophicus]OCH42434.1 hypothetical protein A6E07_07805 [Vibrio cyclitrophicus]PMF37888.1 hypothetical protein BCV14_11195 [Vibrio cyclitrophicus]PMH41983.1 hypothetical protein BCU69_11700 [Vibrio cyclitrophicus]